MFICIHLSVPFVCLFLSMGHVYFENCQQVTFIGERSCTSNDGGGGNSSSSSSSSCSSSNSSSSNSSSRSSIVILSFHYYYYVSSIKEVLNHVY